MNVSQRLRRTAEGYYNPWSPDAKRRRSEQDRRRRANEVAESFHRGNSALQWDNLSRSQQECLRKKYPSQYAARRRKAADTDVVSRSSSPASTERRVFKATKSRLAASATIDDEAWKEKASEASYPPGRDMLSALEDYLNAYEAKKATNTEQSPAASSGIADPSIPAKRCQQDQETGDNASKRLCVSDGTAAQDEGMASWRLRKKNRIKKFKKGHASLPKARTTAEGITYVPLTEEALGSRRLSGHAVMESEKEHLSWWMHNDMLEIVD
ncbi:MAG: hypothetical protein Q9174_001200 [Haloplaca sp. 1 TL-2023]